MEGKNATEANPVPEQKVAVDDEFEILHPEDYQLRSLVQPNSDSQVTTFHFKLSATMSRLNYDKQMRLNPQPDNFIVQVNIADPPEAGAGTTYYKITVQYDKCPAIELKKRFSEIYEYMGELKHHFSHYETFSVEYSIGTQTSQQKNSPLGAKCLGYHFIPNLYKPPAASKVLTKYEEGYFKEDFRVRSYFIRNFLLKVMSHSHLAECEITKNFLKPSEPGEASLAGDGLVTRSKKFAGAVVESVLDLKKYIETPKVSSEYNELRQNLDWLCKYVRSYNQRMKYLHEYAASNRIPNTPAKTDDFVLKGLIEDMDILQYMSEDIWITLDSKYVDRLT